MHKSQFALIWTRKLNIMVLKLKTLVRLTKLHNGRLKNIPKTLQMQRKIWSNFWHQLKIIYIDIQGCQTQARRIGTSVGTRDTTTSIELGSYSNCWIPRSKERGWEKNFYRFGENFQLPARTRNWWRNCVSWNTTIGTMQLQNQRGPLLNEWLRYFPIFRKETKLNANNKTLNWCVKLKHNIVRLLKKKQRICKRWNGRCAIKISSNNEQLF